MDSIHGKDPLEPWAKFAQFYRVSNSINRIVEFSCQIANLQYFGFKNSYISFLLESMEKSHVLSFLAPFQTELRKNATFDFCIL